jgi:RNA polymerase sigma-70 factor, ECF subfamily
MMPFRRPTCTAVPAVPPQRSELVAPDDPLTALALAAGRGTAGAAAAFVEATQGEVWRFVASLTSRAAADDLSQETYLRVLKAFPGFAGRSSARTWLLVIARRVCADHIAAAARQRRVTDRVLRGPAEPAVADPSGSHGVGELLRRLCSERRAAFVLTQVLGLSYAEAATVEQVPVGTIRSRVARARADLIDAVRAAQAS